MKKGTAKSERTKGISLTLPARTNTIQDAIRAQKAGMPIDVMTGYYAEQGMDTGEFFMLDNVEKMHKIAEFRQNQIILKKELESLSNLQISNNDQNQKITEFSGGAISEPGRNPIPGGTDIKPG